MDTLDKLTILADAAKYDAACTSSGVERGPVAGKVGTAKAAGCCHAFTPDGRCVTLLKVLLSNACSYDCAYCVNRASASCARATFGARELAELTVDFYKRNYIEGLFLSSGVLGTPDRTTEHMIECLRVLRDELRFNGYVHAKVIPGTSPELVDAIGRLADRLSVNLELPSAASLTSLCPQKGRADVMGPMAQIHGTRVEEERQLSSAEQRRRRNLHAEPQPLVTYADAHAVPSAMRTDVRASFATNQAGTTATPAVMWPDHPNGCATPKAGTTATPATMWPDHTNGCAMSQAGTVAAPPLAAFATSVPSSPLPLRSNGNELTLRPRSRVAASRRSFAPAGQSTQLIVGATPEDDNHILQLSQALYARFDLKRVFFSAYVPMLADARLPDPGTPTPLRREHRLYQADWLMRYYAFSPDELATPEQPWLDLEVDPKLAWALRHMDLFPVEVNDAPLELLLRVPGIGPVGARRIVAARAGQILRLDDLKRLRITLKRARHFLTCNGMRDDACPADPELIRRRVIADATSSAYNRTRRQAEGQLSLF